MSDKPEQQLAAQFNIVAEYTQHQPKTTTFPGLNTLVDQATKGGNHVFFGEPHVNGLMLRHYEMLANNPDIFTIASKNGVKHLALEFPNDLQESLDAYLDGKTTREDLRNKIFNSADQVFSSPWIGGDAKPVFEKVFMQTIENAKNAGMRVHFADMKSNIFEENQPPEMRAMEKRIIAAHAADSKGMRLLNYAADFYEKLPDSEKKSLKSAVERQMQTNIINRLDDTEQYRYLREKIPLHEGIMGVVGARHLDNGIEALAGRKVMGIDDYLESEGKKVTSIEVHDRQTKGYLPAENKEQGLVSSDMPDYTILIDEEKIYQAGKDEPINQPSTSPQSPIYANKPGQHANF